PAALIAGTTWRRTPASCARAITASRSASNSATSRWQWLSTSSIRAASAATQQYLRAGRQRILAALPVRQHQGAKAQRDLVDEGNRIGQQHADREHRGGELEQGGEAQPARPFQEWQ